MLRNLLRLVAIFIALAVVRAVVGMILNFFRGLSKKSGDRESPTASAGAGAPLSAGLLVKDPVCGTFVSVGTSTKITMEGETFHFCSPACRDKFKGGAKGERRA